MTKDFVNLFKDNTPREDHYYHHEESYYFIHNGIFKDIVGSYGPAEWGIWKGTHLGLEIVQNKIVLNNLTIEDIEFPIELVLSNHDAYFLALNTLYIANTFPIKSYYPEVVSDAGVISKEKVLKRINTSYFDEDINQETKIELDLCLNHYLEIWDALTQDKIDPLFLLQLNGVQILLDMISCPSIITFVDELVNNFTIQTDENQPWNYVIFTFIYNIKTQPELYEFLISKGISKIKFESLYETLENMISEIKIGNGQ